MSTKLSGNQKNIICGIATCLVGAFFFWYSRSQIKVNAFITGYGTDAKTVPSAIFGLMFVLGVVLIIQGVLREKRKYVNNAEFKHMTKDSLVNIGIIALATVIYVVLLQIIGFFVMSTIYMMFLFLFSKVKLLTSAVITVGVDVSLYLIFVVLLKVSITMNVLLI